MSPSRRSRGQPPILPKRVAEKLIGSRVKASTGGEGVYVGELLEVLPTIPWSAKVRITGVLTPAVGLQTWDEKRRGYRPGETVEFEGPTIQPTTETGGTYLDALLAEKARQEREMSHGDHYERWGRQQHRDALNRHIELEERS